MTAYDSAMNTESPDDRQEPRLLWLMSSNVRTRLNSVVEFGERLDYREGISRKLGSDGERWDTLRSGKGG